MFSVSTVQKLIWDWIYCTKRIYSFISKMRMNWRRLSVKLFCIGMCLTRIYILTTHSGSIHTYPTNINTHQWYTSGYWLNSWTYWRITATYGSLSSSRRHSWWFDYPYSQLLSSIVSIFYEGNVVIKIVAQTWKSWWWLILLVLRWVHVCCKCKKWRSSIFWIDSKFLWRR